MHPTLPFKKSFPTRSELTLANSSEEETEVEAEERRYQTKGQEEEIDFKSIRRLQIRRASLRLFVCTAGGAGEAVSWVGERYLKGALPARV